LATQTQLGKVMIPTQIIYWVQLQMYHKREKNMLIENSHAASGTFFFPPWCVLTQFCSCREKKNKKNPTFCSFQSQEPHFCCSAGCGITSYS
jgi:hypothetical protein